MRLTFSFTHLSDLSAVTQPEIYHTHFDLSNDVLKFPDCAQRITSIAQAAGELTEECLFVSCRELGWRNRTITATPKRRNTGSLLGTSIVLVVAFDEGIKYKGDRRYLKILAPVIPEIPHYIQMQGQMHRHEMPLHLAITQLHNLEAQLKTPEQVTYLHQIRIIEAQCLELLKIESADWRCAGIHPAWRDAHQSQVRSNRLKASQRDRIKREREAKKQANLQQIEQTNAAEAARPKKGRIYFIQQGENGAIKIGYSTNPEKRLMTLRTASPYPLRVLQIIEGGKNREQELHRLFAHLRLDGEWFQAVGELLEYIITLPDA